MTSSLQSKVEPFGDAVDALTSFMKLEGDVETPGGPMPGLRKTVAQMREVALLQVDDAIGDFKGAVEAVLSAEEHTEAQAGIATAAALASSNAQYDYMVDNAAGRLALTGVTANQRAFQRDSEHIYQYNGSEWIDRGLAPTATKADKSVITVDFGNPDLLGRLLDAMGLQFAAWLKDGGQYAGALALADEVFRNVLQIDGTSRLGFGDGEKVSFYGMTVSTAYNNPDVFYQVLSADGSVLSQVLIDGTIPGSGSEMAAAVSALSQRLDVSARADGLLKEEVYGRWLLPETRRKLASLQAGEGGQCLITVIGNSWADTAAYFVRTMTRALKKRYGDAGAGFGNRYRGFADPEEATMTQVGAWTTLNAATANGVDAPGACIIQDATSTVGAYQQVSLLKGRADAVKLFSAASGAVVDILKNGVSVGQVTVSSIVTVLPVTLAAGDVLRVAHVSGTWTCYGVQLTNTDPGVQVNKCGAGSSRWARWLAVNAATWQTQMTALAGDCTLMLEGVNGCHDYNATTEATYTGQMISRVRAATPKSDVLLISPPVTLDTSPYSLRDFAYALRAAAPGWKVCHLDLQYAFGQDVTDYNDAGRGYITTADINHPQPAGSGVIAGSVLKVLN